MAHLFCLCDFLSKGTRQPHLGLTHPYVSFQRAKTAPPVFTPVALINVLLKSPDLISWNLSCMMTRTHTFQDILGQTCLSLVTVGTLVYSSLVRSTGATWDLQVASEVGTETLTCGISCWLQVDSVRTEMNCRTPSWCWELVGMGISPHLECQKYCECESKGETRSFS